MSISGYKVRRGIDNRDLAYVLNFAVFWGYSSLSSSSVSSEIYSPDAIMRDSRARLSMSLRLLARLLARRLFLFPGETESGVPGLDREAEEVKRLLSRLNPTEITRCRDFRINQNVLRL